MISFVLLQNSSCARQTGLTAKEQAARHDLAHVVDLLQGLFDCSGGVAASWRFELLVLRFATDRVSMIQPAHEDYLANLGAHTKPALRTPLREDQSEDLGQVWLDPQ